MINSQEESNSAWRYLESLAKDQQCAHAWKMTVYQKQELEEKHCNSRALNVLFHNRIQKAGGKIDDETRKVGMG